MLSASKWKAEVRAQLELLASVFEDRFGYPFDESANYVSDAGPAGADLAESFDLPGLSDLYDEVGEVALPDVGNGYFVHPAERLRVAADWGLPVTVENALIGDVATFGSDGAGGFFSLCRGDGAVYYLPPGRLTAGIYTAGLDEPRRIADDIEGYCGRLLLVIREFVATGNVMTP